MTVPKIFQACPRPKAGACPGRWSPCTRREWTAGQREESSGRTGGPLFLPPQVGGNPDAVNRLVGFYLRGILQIRYRIETNAERAERGQNLDRAAEHSR